jgi:hypothetical protein
VATETRQDGSGIGEIADASEDEVPADNWGLPPDFDLNAYPLGTAEVSESGIDLSQLRNNLRLTPEERLRKVVKFVAFIRMFHRVGAYARTNSL